MSDLYQKLALSKAIMDKAEKIERGKIQENPSVSDFQIPNAKYNIPENYLDEKTTIPKSQQSTKEISVDAIKNSKLPDEIKKLMIEHPIQQTSFNQPVLSDEIVEKATRLMHKNDNNYIPESAKTKKTSNQTFDYDSIKSIIKETVKEVLSENGLISESTEKSNEIFSFRVGKHIFEGKITKIKKIP